MEMMQLAHIKVKGLIHELKNSTKGATMIEYSILIGIITAGVVATVGLMGGKVGTWWGDLNTNTN